MANAIDKDQIAMLKEWWQEWGKGLTVAIIVGVGIGLIWRFWHQRHVHQVQEASVVYSALERAFALNDEKAVMQWADTLQKDYTKTPYAGMGELFRGAWLTKKSDFVKAQMAYQWVIDHGQMSSVREVARLRMARILIAQNKPQLALTALKKVDDRSYEPLIDQVKGDAFHALGNESAAQKAYQAAQAGFAQQNITNSYLEMRLLGT